MRHYSRGETRVGQREKMNTRPSNEQVLHNIAHIPPTTKESETSYYQKKKKEPETSTINKTITPHTFYLHQNMASKLE